MYIIDVLISILQRIFDIVKRMWQNDKEATIMGVVLYFVGMSLLSIQKNTQWGLFGRDGSHEFFSFLFWVLMAAYVGGLYHLMKTGQKLNLFKSFKRAKDAVMVGPKAQSPEKKETEPIKPKATDDDKRVSEVKPVPQTNPDKPQHQNTPPSHPGTVYKPDAKLETAVKKGIRFTGEFLKDGQQRDGKKTDVEKINEELHKRIKGQDHAVKAFVNTFSRRTAGLMKPKGPLATFMLTGPTGTGKSELAKAVAAATGRPLIQFNMGDFQHEKDVAMFNGSPPGYIGSDKPGAMTGAIRSNPDAVVLLDEVEKACSKIWDAMLAVFEDGKLKDASGGWDADFSQSILIMTSNLVFNTIFTDDDEEIRESVNTSGYFRPEMVNRIDRFIMFKPLSAEVIREIALKEIQSYIQSFVDHNKLHNTSVDIDKAVVEQVVASAKTKHGARSSKRYIDSVIGTALADQFLAHKNSAISQINIFVNEENKVEVAIR